MSLDGRAFYYCGTLFVMRILVRGVVIALTIAIAGCGGGVSENVSVTSNSAVSVTSNSPILTIDFTASLIDGSPIRLAEQLAINPVALWFWAPG